MRNQILCLSACLQKLRQVFLITHRGMKNLQIFLHSLNSHFFIKSCFFGVQQISFNPAGILSLKDTLKIYKGQKNRKIRKPSGLSLNPLLKKQCHLLSDKLESMEICLRVNDTLITVFQNSFDRLCLNNLI